MSLGGWIVMGISWAVIFGLFVFCLHRALYKPNSRPKAEP